MHIFVLPNYRQTYSVSLDHINMGYKYATYVYYDSGLVRDSGKLAFSLSHLYIVVFLYLNYTGTHSLPHKDEL